MLKALIDIVGRKAPEPVIDGNQERPLPQRWRDPAPKPVRQLPFGLRAH